MTPGAGHGRLEIGAVVGVTVQDASGSDTTPRVTTLATAGEQVEMVLPEDARIARGRSGQRWARAASHGLLRPVDQLKAIKITDEGPEAVTGLDQRVEVLTDRLLPSPTNVTACGNRQLQLQEPTA